ncbi:unnamed protein product [Cunninghamella echinulata]
MYYPTLTKDIIGWGLSAFLSSFIIIIRELNPNTQFGYSKFTKLNKKDIMVPSRLGMLVIYIPSLIVCLISLFSWSSSQPIHVQLVSFFSSLHFLKRLYEVLFVHRYSGQSVLQHNIIISFSYVGFSICQLYFTSLVPSHALNQSEMKLGMCLFFLGEGLNHYHHCILSNLRSGESKEYKIPTGGLFKYIWCPHYLGEIISFIAMTFLSQHILVFIFQLSSAAYLAVRAYNTKLWYHQRFKSIPRKASLFPGLF